MGKIVVVILHYRGVADTMQCLRSVLPQRHAGLDVLLVDNGSDDGLAEALRADAMDVAVLRLAENQGWAGGNNAGIGWARERGADGVCLLNNDTVVPAGVFDRLASVVRERGLCLMHPAIDFADPAEGAQIDPKQWGFQPLEPEGVVYRMGFSYGACLMIPVGVFDRVGLFDERFFLQLEETDFCRRCERAGIEALCDVSVRIVHAESRAFGGRGTAEKTYYVARNFLLLAAKHWRWPREVKGIMRRGYWNMASVAGLGEKPPAWRMARWALSGHGHARAMRHGIRDFARGRFGRRPAGR